MENRQGGFNPGPAGRLDNSGMARTSTIIGIAMLVAWILPLIGFPLGTAGLVFGLTSLGSSRADLARAGVFLNGLGLFLTGINMLVSFYLVVTGKFDPFTFFR